MARFNRRVVLIGAAVIAVVVAGYFAMPQRDNSAPQQAPEPLVADAGVVTEIVGAAIVADGDTIRIGPRHIRFDGIDAPRQGRMCGDVNIYRAAGNALREVTDRQEVRCRISDQPDDKGRDFAQCHVGAIDLNEYMVSNGWARDWPLHSNGDYADEEAEARAAQRGVWSPSCPADLWTAGRDYSR